MTIVYFDYVQRSCSSLYRLPRFINCPTYITLHYSYLQRYFWQIVTRHWASYSKKKSNALLPSTAVYKYKLQTVWKSTLGTLIKIIAQYTQSLKATLHENGVGYVCDRMEY